MSSSTKASEENGFKKPMALGSKSRSFIPMTPRSLKTNSEHRNDFARQVADHSSRDQDGQPPKKKFRSSAAPKGTKLASGYIDRAQERSSREDNEDDDKQKRLKALEEMLKLQQIDQATFESLRDEIGIGGDTSSTHLVKGLDFKLLERIRRGEDIENTSEEDKADFVPAIDVEDELERVLDTNVAVRTHSNDRRDENDHAAQPDTIHEKSQNTPLSRDEILQRMRQSRKNSKLLSGSEPPLQVTPAEARLDQSRFRKLESKTKPNKQKFIETINGRRREVLVITDKEGKTKRKTRWLDPEPDPSAIKSDSDKNQAWGGDLPAEVLARQQAAEEQAARQKAEEEDEDGDIFGGVADYDPLAGIDSDEEDVSKTVPPAQDASNASNDVSKEEENNESSSISKPLKSTSTSRNYFSTSNDPDSNTTDSATRKPAHDPSILAAFKRAAQIRQEEGDPTHESLGDTDQLTENQARSKALLAKLQKQSGYDDADVDMEYGGDSRYDDEEDNGKQKLSQWSGIGDQANEDDEDGGAEKKGGAKRKRGGKKKKGDKNSFTDVMSVIEGRKKT